MKLTTEQLDVRLRKAAVQHSITLPHTDQPVRALTWKELHSQRAALRKISSAVMGDVDDSDAKTAEEAFAVAEHAAATCQSVSNEMDEREASGSRDPRPALAGKEDRPLNGANRSRYIWRDQNGNEHRAYRHDEPLEYRGPESSELEQFSFGKFFRGVILGEWNDAELERNVMVENRTMTEGTDSAGGYAVPDRVGTQVLELVRNNSVVNRAGATTIPVTSDNTRLVRETGAGSAQWLAESAEPTMSDLTFDAVTIQPKLLAIYMRASLELLNDNVVGLHNFVEQSMARSLATELDRVALSGDGSGAEPTGVLNASGINAYDNTGGAASYDMISQAVEEIRADNHEPNAIILSPNTAGRLDRLKDTTNQPLQRPPSVNGLQFLPTNQVGDIGASPAEHEAIVGEFRHLILGMRQKIVIQASNVAADGAGNSAWTQRQIWFRAFMRADIALAYAPAFCQIDKIEAV